MAVVAVVAVGSLASASPSLREPRGPHEGATGATGGSDASAAGSPGSPIDPGAKDRDETPSGFSGCRDVRGLDRAICRLEALLVVYPDNQGLQIALDHLQSNQAKHGGGRPSGEKSSDDGSGEVVGHSSDGNEDAIGNAGGDQQGIDDAGGDQQGNDDAGGVPGNHHGNGSHNAGGNEQGNDHGRGNDNAGGNGH